MLQINEILEWNLKSNEEIDELHRKLGELIHKSKNKSNKDNKEK